MSDQLRGMDEQPDITLVTSTNVSTRMKEGSTPR
jgi:hypothetical protein